MAMSKKDYILIASTFNVVRRATVADGLPEGVAAIDLLADTLAIRLAADNPSFNDTTFRAAVRRSDAGLDNEEG